MILAIITATAYSLQLVKKNLYKKAQRFDMIAAQIVLIIYVLLNIIFIVNAVGE